MLFVIRPRYIRVCLIHVILSAEVFGRQLAYRDINSVIVLAKLPPPPCEKRLCAWRFSGSFVLSWQQIAGLVV